MLFACAYQIYILSGAVSVNGKVYEPYHTVVLTSAPGESGVQLASAHTSNEEETRFVLIAGKPLQQRVVQHGPFVLDSNEGIYQAFEECVLSPLPFPPSLFLPTLLVNLAQNWQLTILHFASPESYQGQKNGFERAKGWASEIGKRML